MRAVPELVIFITRISFLSHAIHTYFIFLTILVVTSIQERVLLGVYLLHVFKFPLHC